jgi:hypothetical protein
MPVRFPTAVGIGLSHMVTRIEFTLRLRVFTTTESEKHDGKKQPE